MTMRRDTRVWLSEDAGLFDQILARMCGAWDVDGELPDKPPSPYEVCKTMGLSYGALLAWVTVDDARQKRYTRMLDLRARVFWDIYATAIADDSAKAAKFLKPLRAAMVLVERRVEVSSPPQKQPEMPPEL